MFGHGREQIGQRAAADMDVQVFVDIEHHHPVRLLHGGQGQCMGIGTVAKAFGVDVGLCAAGNVGDCAGASQLVQQGFGAIL